ncbi:lipoyl domain-containing protein [Tenacibaculum ovolyticum]|uniref:lipoyl domain-containing protein n=1 Tax=Tenacibaculum ovolyticum TaxID=104270 RepID=UPI003BAABD61
MKYHKIIKIPFISEEIKKITINKLYKKVGEHVSSDDVFAEFENDKAAFDISIDFDGILLKYFIKEKDQVNIGDDFCLIASFTTLKKVNNIHKSLNSIQSDFKTLYNYYEFFTKTIETLNLPDESTFNDVLKVIKKLKKN